MDLENNPIKFWSKLYPWEWLAKESFGGHLLDDKVGVLEPVWKMLLSNKAILPILWQLFPNHPNLLPAFFDKNDIVGDYVTKPILAREGANIEVITHGTITTKTEGSYGDSTVIYQSLANLPMFDSQYVVLGSWMVGDKAAGMIVRESDSPIVVSAAKVVPHYISD